MAQLLLLALLGVGATVGVPSIPTPPVWPNRYFVEGSLNLPYAQLHEPFAIWYDGGARKSRMDFYDGMSITVQRADQGDLGKHYMVAPMTTETVLNQKTCFEVDGTPDAPVTPQTVLPDISNFTFAGIQQYEDRDVEVWQYDIRQGQKDNHYSLYLDKQTRLPVFYEMLGYDSLIGSHFDDYKVKYGVFSVEFSDTVFDIPMAGLSCQGFPGPGHEGRIVTNPMQEFIHPVKDDHLHVMFNEFVAKYNKKEANKSPDVYHQKKSNFKHNLRYINSINRRGLTFKLAVNHLADYSHQELRAMHGRRTTVGFNGKTNNGRPFVSKLRANDIPDTKDWRLYGAVTPVKDQATCGSCWSFGTTGSVEGAHFLKTGRLIRLSQQNLMDCSWGFGNNACDGGEEWRSYEYMMKHGGIMSELDYGHYLGQDGYCHFNATKVTARISYYVNVTSGDLDALKVAIAEHGPVAVGIDAAHLSLSFYSNGVYYEPSCGNKPENLDHAVLAVGYGELDGEKYWLIKNSWSTYWGNDGYVLMSQRDNNCGVATDATFVVME